MIRFTRLLGGAVAAAAVFAAAGPAAAQTRAKAGPAATTFIGTLPAEPPARVAVVVEGDTFLAYACGRTDDFNRAASAWFTGKVRDGRIAATVDGKTLAAELVGGTVRGSLTAGGKAREFTAEPVSPAAVAGLYRATTDVAGEAVVMGWIVDVKHQVVGGCQGKKRQPVALQPARPLPAPPPPAEDPPAEVVQAAEELLIGQVEDLPDVAVQGEKVRSAVKPPAGKVVRAAKKK